MPEDIKVTVEVETEEKKSKAIPVVEDKMVPGPARTVKVVQIGESLVEVPDEPSKGF